MKLKDKVAIVTGAARGIGRSIAIKLASEGANIVIADYDISEAQSVIDEICKFGVKAIQVKANVADLESVDNLIKLTLDEFGKIDILINNAGITRDGLILKMSEQDWDAVIDVNLKGTFNCIKAVTKVLLKQKTGGRIVNMASVMGIIGNAGQANYSASKAGVIGLTKTTAKELGSRGINVNAIAPGFIQTAMTDELSDSIKEKILDQIPLKKLGAPDDVAKAALFLCSEESEYITGQVINVDGGMVM